MEKEVVLSLAIIHHFSMVNNDVGKQAYTVFRHMGNPSKLQGLKVQLKVWEEKMIEKLALATVWLCM